MERDIMITIENDIMETIEQSIEPSSSGSIIVRPFNGTDYNGNWNYIGNVFDNNLGSKAIAVSGRSSLHLNIHLPRVENLKRATLKLVASSWGDNNFIKILAQENTSRQLGIANLTTSKRTYSFDITNEYKKGFDLLTLVPYASSIVWETSVEVYELFLEVENQQESPINLMKIGDLNVSKCYIGNGLVSKIYLGNTLVFGSQQ